MVSAAWTTESELTHDKTINSSFGLINIDRKETKD